MMSTNWIDKYNATVGAITSVLVAVFGVYWYVFASYLLLNVIDCLIGTHNAMKDGKCSSAKKREGIWRKVGNWLIIMLAFLCGDILTFLVQSTTGIEVGFLSGIGWITVCMLWINEVRSILELLVEMGCNVPEFLVKGLEVTSKLVNAKTNSDVQEGEEK